MTEQGYIDVSAWIGTWPFDLNREVTLARLIEQLASMGIAEALVSPLAAVLASDPMPANRALLTSIEDADDLPMRPWPAPVVNPVLSTWRQDLASVVEQGRGVVVAIRLIPTWHGWDLDHPEATACIRAIGEQGLIPVIQARMIDERARPIAAMPGTFHIEQTVAWLRALEDVPTVLAGLYRTELPAIAEMDHVAVDLSFIESGDTLATVLEVLPRERVLLGTHAPIHEPLAGVGKLPGTGSNAPVARQIGTSSARMWLGLDPTVTEGLHQ